MATHYDDQQLNAMKGQGRLLIQKKRLQEAKALFTDMCGHEGADAEAWYLLGSVHGMLGDIDAAGECCRRAIALQPDYCDALVNLGHVCLSQGKRDEALSQYEATLNINPQHAGALSGLGNVLTAMGKTDEAVESYEAALRINPNLIENYCNLGTLKRSQKKYRESEEYYRQAIRLHPRYAAAHNFLGSVLYFQGKIEQGIEHVRRALALDPGLTAAYNELGYIQCNEGNLSEAASVLKAALKIDPESAVAYSNLGSVRNRQGRPEDALVMFREALRLLPHRADILSSALMTMQYLPDYSTDELREAACSWNLKYCPEGKSDVPPITDADPRRRLRLGYVSADFRNHPVGYFIEAVLNHHDRSSHEVFCYSNAETCDDLTERLQGQADHWRMIIDQSDTEVIDQIRSDGIDVLIDLSGHTAMNRLPVFAHKPAPVQVTWMGYVATTGLEAMDYIIADRYVIPAREEHHFVEQVVHMPQSYLCFSPPRHAIDVSPPPMTSNGYVTFGCFQNIAKLGRSVDCWSQLLRSVPDAQLHLRNKSLGDAGVRAWCTALFAERGVAAERISMRGFAPREELLAAYGEVDIALDPFPYNGGTTTVEALWMGVPVISMRGERFVSRVGESILTNVGLAEFVVDTEDAYVAKAMELAADPARLTAMRAQLRGRLEHSPLCDGPAFTRSLEAAYRAMWEACCRK